MTESKHYTKIGIASIIIGIIGLILYFIGWFFFTFVDNRLYGMVVGMILSIVAIILGYVARRQGDTFGTYGILLGTLVLIIGLLTFLLTTPVYVETGYSS